MNPPLPQTPVSVRDKVDFQAAELCSDTGVLDADLPQKLVPLILTANLANDLAGLWSARHHRDRSLQGDYASAMLIELIGHLHQVDRRRIADGASFCGWMRNWGIAVLHKVEREIDNTTRRSSVPISGCVSLDALAEEAGVTDVGNLEHVRRNAPPLSNTEPDLVESAQVRAALARKRGAGRQEAVSRIVRDTLAITPLIRPPDPVETQLVRSLIATEPRLARLSLDSFCALVDNDRRPVSRELVPEAMIAMWDSTTAQDRLRLNDMPDRIPALLVEDAVRLAPRPRPRVRRTVRNALRVAASQAPTDLLDELTDSFWDESTEAVSDHRTDISETERQQIRHRAALKARRFPDLARALARIPQAHAGRDVAEVRTFLCQAWAMAEAALPPLKRRRRAPAES